MIMVNHSSHVLDYYTFRLGEADYASVYGAVPRDLGKTRHVGDYYYSLINALMLISYSLG